MADLRVETTSDGRRWAVPAELPASVWRRISASYGVAQMHTKPETEANKYISRMLTDATYRADAEASRLQEREPHNPLLSALLHMGQGATFNYADNALDNLRTMWQGFTNPDPGDTLNAPSDVRFMRNQIGSRGELREHDLDNPVASVAGSLLGAVGVGIPTGGLAAPAALARGGLPAAYRALRGMSGGQLVGRMAGLGAAEGAVANMGEHGETVKNAALGAMFGAPAAALVTGAGVGLTRLPGATTEFLDSLAGYTREGAPNRLIQQTADVLRDHAGGVQAFSRNMASDAAGVPPGVGLVPPTTADTRLSPAASMQSFAESNVPGAQIVRHLANMTGRNDYVAPISERMARVRASVPEQINAVVARRTGVATGAGAAPTAPFTDIMANMDTTQRQAFAQLNEAAPTPELAGVFDRFFGAQGADATELSRAALRDYRKQIPQIQGTDASGAVSFINDALIGQSPGHMANLRTGLKDAAENQGVRHYATHTMPKLDEALMAASPQYALAHNTASASKAVRDVFDMGVASVAPGVNRADVLRDVAEFGKQYNSAVAAMRNAGVEVPRSVQQGNPDAAFRAGVLEGFNRSLRGSELQSMGERLITNSDDLHGWLARAFREDGAASFATREVTALDRQAFRDLVDVAPVLVRMNKLERAIREAGSDVTNPARANVSARDVRFFGRFLAADPIWAFMRGAEDVGAMLEALQRLSPNARKELLDFMQADMGTVMSRMREPELMPTAVPVAGSGAGVSTGDFEGALEY